MSVLLFYSTLFKVIGHHWVMNCDRYTHIYRYTDTLQQVLTID